MIYELHFNPKPQEGLWDLLETVHCRGQQVQSQSVSIADCCDARREGPHYDMMQSVGLLGLHDLTMALPAMKFLLVTSPRLMQSTSCQGHIASGKIQMISFHMTKFH